MTMRPRITVATGQPVTVTPSKGDQAHWEASQSAVISRLAF